MAFLAARKKREEPKTPIERAKRWLSYELPKPNRADPRSLAFAFAIAAKGYGLTEEEVRVELILTGRFSEGSTTIERAIANACGSVTGEYKKGAAWPSPNIPEVEGIVASSKLTVASLVNSPNNRLFDDWLGPYEALSTLFYPKCLVCVGSLESSVTMPIGNLSQRGDSIYDLEYIVPNPMARLTGKVKDGERNSKRCRDNACRLENLRYQVIECDLAKFKKGKPTVWHDAIERWESQDLTVKDVGVRIVAHLLVKHRWAKLAMVIDSGGKSLHAWLNVKDAEPSALAALRHDGARLGADTRLFLPEQLARFPMGTRTKDGELAAQMVCYWNPDNAAKSEIGTGEGA
jgi:hypothetical protein